MDFKKSDDENDSSIQHEQIMNDDFCNEFYQRIELSDMFSICEKIRKKVIQEMSLNPLIFFQRLWKTICIIPYDNNCRFYYDLRSIEDKFFKPIIGANALKNKNMLCLPCRRIQRLSNFRIGVEYQLFTFFDQIVKVSHSPFYPIVDIYQYNDKNIIQLDKNTNQLITSWIIGMDPIKSYFFVNNYFAYICCGQLTQIEEYQHPINFDNIDIENQWKLILIQLIIISATLKIKKIIHGDIKMENFIISLHEYDYLNDKHFISFNNKEYYTPFVIKLKFTGKSQIELDSQNIIKNYSIFDQKIDTDPICYDKQFEQIIRCFLQNDKFNEAVSSDDDIYSCIWKDDNGIEFNSNCMLELIDML